MLGGLVTAIRTLTVLRIPGRDSTVFARSLYYFPLVGAGIGFAAGGAVLVTARITGWPEISAAAGAVVSMILTGCLHVDGLADVFDSLGGYSREKRLEIMKDSRSGVFGAAAIAVSLLLKYVCFLRLQSWDAVAAVSVVMAVSRTAQVGVIVGMPYARSTGTAAAFIEGASARHLVFSAMITAGFAWWAAGRTGLTVFLAGVAAVLLARLWTRRTLGGVTGDVIGFTNEVAEIAGLVVIAL